MRKAHLITRLAAMTTILAASAVTAQVAAPDFATACKLAMDKMMTGMDVAPSGNVDRDFVAMMTPHHQGAIDMAIAELRYGHDEQLKRIAQEIIVDQQQEIAAMKLALGEPLPASVAAPTQSPPASHHMHMQMEK